MRFFYNCVDPISSSKETLLVRFLHSGMSEGSERGKDLERRIRKGIQTWLPSLYGVLVALGTSCERFEGLVFVLFFSVKRYQRQTTANTWSRAWEVFYFIFLSV